MTTRIKICGITSATDALAVARLGADEIGFNFYSLSPRAIDPETARSISVQLPSSVKRVGIFVNAPLDEVVANADHVGLDAIQLHGDEPVDYLAAIRQRTKRFIIKAVGANALSELKPIVRAGIDAVLLDSPHTGQYGGTGKAFEWHSVSEHVSLIPMLYLAGGLNEKNVASAIRELRPFAVDACSQLESMKGRKDLNKVELFIREVRSVI